jgi:acetyl esterase/lipase
MLIKALHHYKTLNKLYDSVRDNAKEWGIIKIKLASWGFSAGDILHLQLLHILLLKQTHAIMIQPCEPDFAILLYPVISFDTTFAHIGSRNKLIGTKPTADKTAFFSNELQVTTKTPPIYCTCQ